ncbi:MAG: SDR family NAD(P)-dependent oxidoreductase, partial [Sphingobacteriales bacterium]
MFPLKDKVVAITGASSGIGKALALTAVQLGAKVAVCARNEQRLKEGFDNSNIFCVGADVSKEDDCKRFIDATIAQWGRVDVLINNAGISMRALFEDVAAVFFDADNDGDA